MLRDNAANELRRLLGNLEGILADQEPVMGDRAQKMLASVQADCESVLNGGPVPYSGGLAGFRWLACGQDPAQVEMALRHINAWFQRNCQRPPIPVEERIAAESWLGSQCGFTSSQTKTFLWRLESHPAAVHSLACQGRVLVPAPFLTVFPSDPELALERTSALNCLLEDIVPTDTRELFPAGLAEKLSDDFLRRAAEICCCGQRTAGFDTLAETGWAGDFDLVCGYLVKTNRFTENRIQETLDKLIGYIPSAYEFIWYCRYGSFIPDFMAHRVFSYTAKRLSDETRLNPLGAFNFLIYLHERPESAFRDLRAGLPVK